MSADDEIILDFLERWEDARVAGNDLAIEELCQARPDLVEVVRAKIAALEASAWMEPNRTAATESRVLAGRYRLERLIGQGGYGQVWRAYDEELHRPVAVKVPHSSRRLGERQIDQLLAEARRVAGLRHPGIVTVHDVLKEGAAYVIVNDLIDGEDLAERLRRGPLSPAEAVRILAQVARVLDYAHGQGVIHRDIKPSNVLLGLGGSVHVCDFGIAATQAELLDSNDRRATLAYASPEQLGDGPVDHRTDIWSLGIMMFETLTGRRPFDADDPVRLQQQIFTAELPAMPGVPEPLAAVCRRCLAKKPEDRFARGNDVAAALEAAIQFGPRRRTIFWAVLAVLAVGMAISVWTFLIPKGQPGGSPTSEGIGRPSDAENQKDKVVAEWVVRHGGRIKYKRDGVEQELDADDLGELPSTPFRVTEIDLHRAKGVSDDDVDRFLGLPALQRLKLTQTPVTDNGVRRLEQLEVELEWLDLTGTKATAASLPVAVAKLQPNGVLFLGGLPIGDDDLGHLLAKPTMRALALNYTRVSDQGMAVIARCERLHFLDLSGTRLTAAGIHLLYALKRLEYLILTDVRLDAEAFEALKGLTWVKQMTLGRADPDSVERLQKSLPGCRVIAIPMIDPKLGTGFAPVRETASPRPPVRVLEGHTTAIRAVRFLPDGGWIASADEKTLRFWPPAGDPVGVNLSSPPTSVAFDPRGMTVLTGHEDGVVRQWWIGARTANEQAAGWASWAMTCGWNQLGLIPFTPSRKDTFLIRSWPGDGTPIQALAISPSGKWAAWTTQKKLFVWDVAGNRSVPPRSKPEQATVALLFLPDADFKPDELLLVGWHNGPERRADLSLWKPVTFADGLGLSPRGTMQNFGMMPGVQHVAADANFKFIVATLEGGLAAFVKAGDAPGFHLLAQLGHKMPGTRQTAILSGANRTLSYGEDRTLCLWEPKPQAQRIVSDPHPMPVTDVAVSPDGALAATGCRDGKVRVWRLVDGE